jgi:TrmH family RNA methyltransferase
MLDIASYFRYVESPQNEFIKRLKIHIEGGARANKLRKETGQALIEGIHLMDAWVKAHQIHNITSILTNSKSLENPEINLLIQACILDCEANDRVFPEMILVDESLCASLTTLVNGPLLVCTVKIPTHEYGLGDKVDTLVLDGVQDSGNVGTMLRTAAAAGFFRIICTPGTASIWSLKVLRAAMGGHLFLEFMESVSVKSVLENTNNSLLVTNLNTQALDVFELGDRLRDKVTWVMGNEGKGAHPLFLEKATSVHIPQEKGVESLNVSSACSVCLFETIRIRKYAETVRRRIN